VRRITKAALTIAATVSMVAVLAAAAGPALAKLVPFRLVCGAVANGGALENGVCVLPFGQTTAPNSYSATITTSTGKATTTFAVSAGSLPPGLTLPAQPGSGSAVISGNPTQAGVYDFTIAASTAPGGATVTLAYEITITVQGAPDQLVCTPAANGGFLESGVCVLPDAIAGVPYQGHLLTSHNAGGTLSIIAGALPAGLSLPATFGTGGDVITGTATGSGSDFTVQGTGDLGQPLYQAYSITVDPDQPLTVVLPAAGSGLGDAVGGAFEQNLFLSGGAAPYTWSVASGQLPPGVTLQTFSDPRDADDLIAGTPTTAGTYVFTMKVTDYDGQQATQQFTFTVHP